MHFNLFNLSISTLEYYIIISFAILLTGDLILSKFIAIMRLLKYLKNLICKYITCIMIRCAGNARRKHELFFVQIVFSHNSKNSLIKK